MESTLRENDENAALVVSTKSGKRKMPNPIQPTPSPDDDEGMRGQHLVHTSSHRTSGTNEDEEVMSVESSFPTRNDSMRFPDGFRNATSARHKEFVTIAAVDLQHMIDNSRRITEQKRLLRR